MKGKEKKEREGFNTWKKQPIRWNSNNRRHILKPKNEPLSNVDLMKWIRKLGIIKFRGIFSRDNLPRQINDECGIINLDTQIGPGTHWVCYRNFDNYCEYFDSFGLDMPKDVERYLISSNKRIIYSGDEIQERSSVLCGYWCLYYLFERQRGTSLLDAIHNSYFDANNQMVNKKFLMRYFNIE